jgi:hypothetical protein
MAGMRAGMVDLPAAEAAAAAFLTALGLRLDREATVDTPARMARAYAELLTAREFDPTTFADEEGYNQCVRASRVAVPGYRRRGLPAGGTNHRPVQADPGGGVVRPPAAGAGRYSTCPTPWHVCDVVTRARTNIRTPM